MAAGLSMSSALPLTLSMQPFADSQHGVAPADSSGAAGGGGGAVSSSLYAYGLPSALTDSDLHELFGIYGGVSSVHIMRNDNGTPKGYAFINMKSVQDAAVAQMYLDHFPMGGRTLRVQFKRQHNSNNNNGNSGNSNSQQQQQQQQQHTKQKCHTANATATTAAAAPQQQTHYSQPESDSGSDSASSSHTG